MRNAALRLGLALPLAACSPPAVQHAGERIAFDLDAIDAAGLEGPPDGLRAVDYEFCVPDAPGPLREVRVIDPSARPQPGARGRVGCGAGQVLVLGNTHRHRWRQSLERLAALPYVKRIARSEAE